MPTDKPNQILIVGCPRSGTSLLQTLMTTCFEGCWQPPQFENRPMSYFWSDVWPPFVDRCNEEGRALPETIVWKIPEMPIGAGAAYERLVAEGCHVIGLVRHPAAVALSKQGGRPYWNEVAPGLFGKERSDPYAHWTAMVSQTALLDVSARAWRRWGMTAEAENQVDIASTRARARKTGILRCRPGF